MKDVEKLVVSVEGNDITVRRTDGRPDYISLTDIAKKENDEPNAVIQNWMRKRATIEFLGLWEEINNPDFMIDKAQEYFLKAGSNSFTMSPKKWIQDTAAIGLESRAGRYGGGTYAHEEIALEFLSWISPKHKLYFLQEYKKLKVEESQRQLSGKGRKVAYLPLSNEEAIITGLPPKIEWDESYANLTDDDIFNVALFGMTQGQFEEKYPNARGLVRENSSLDHIVSIQSLRGKQADLIAQGLSKEELLTALNAAAIDVISSLTNRRQYNRNLSLLPPTTEIAFSPVQAPHSGASTDTVDTGDAGSH